MSKEGEAPTAAAPAGLGDFFKAKAKKKIKGSNLNNSAAPKVEAKKPGKKDAEEEGWEEEQVAIPNLKVEVAGKLTRDEDKKEEEDSSAPAWNIKNKGDKSDLSDKKFPTLAKSIQQSSNINIDDGSDPKINIQTSKNAFSALEGAHDSDEDGPKRPKEIKPWQVQKKKGEFEKVAIAREKDKYGVKKEENKASKKKKNDEDDDDDEEEEDESEEEVAVVTKTEAKKKKKATKEEKEEPEEPAEEKAEDLMIQPDLVAAKAKYAHRRKLPKVDLPQEELEEEKENKPVPQGKKGKKKAYVDEEAMYEKKLAYADW